MTGRGRDALAHWYRDHGRHELPWRARRDRWAVLVAEVMLHQTQVGRVAAAWDEFIERFPTPAAMAAAAPGDVIVAWGRLGYPRRARRLWEAATIIVRDGWPPELATLPGVGRYTAAAVAAQADDRDVVGVEVNIRRVCERVHGGPLTERSAERIALAVAGDALSGRDRLLALMDLGATVCTARAPRCEGCPLRAPCSTRGTAPHELARARQAPFEGSFRQRRGRVLARLRTETRGVPVSELDADALTSLVDDGLATVAASRAYLPDA